MAHVLAVIALGSPATAARCLRLLSALPNDVRSAIARLASAPAVRDPATATADLRHWLTVAEAAAQLGISKHGVRDLCRRGRLAATKHRVTGTWRIDPASIERSRQ